MKTGTVIAPSITQATLQVVSPGNTWAFYRTILLDTIFAGEIIEEPDPSGRYPKA